MEKTLQLIESFEKRNNISIAVTFYGDGSGTVSEFWDYQELKEFKTIDDLHKYLINTQYKLAHENGRCLSPVQVVDHEKLSIKQVAARYGQKVKCKWLTPDGNDWLDKEMTVNAHFLKGMEQGSIKDCRYYNRSGHT